MKQFPEQMSDFDKRRVEAWITDRQLADISGVGVEMISKYRNGHRRPSIDNWIALNNGLEALIRAQHHKLKELMR